MAEGKNRIESALGLDRLTQMTQDLRDQQERIKADEGLDESSRKRMLQTMSDSMFALTTGSIMERMKAAERIEKGEDPVNDVLRSWMGKHLEQVLDGGGRQSPGDVLMMRLMERAADAIPIGASQEQRRDAMSEALNEVAAEWVRERFGKAPSSGRESETDPIYAAARSQMQSLVQRALEQVNQPPPSAIDQVQHSIQTLSQMKELAEAMGWAGSGSPERQLELEKQKFELDLKRLDMEEKLGLYRIDQELTAEREKAQAMNNLVSLLGRGIETIGESLGRMIASGDFTEEAPAPAAMRQGNGARGVQHMECPDCGQRAIALPQAVLEAVQSGQVREVRCEHCGAVHTLGDSRASSNGHVPERDEDDEDGEGEEEEDEGMEEVNVTVAR